MSDLFPARITWALSQEYVLIWVALTQDETKASRHACHQYKCHWYILQHKMCQTHTKTFDSFIVSICHHATRNQWKRCVEHTCSDCVSLCSVSHLYSSMFLAFSNVMALYYYSVFWGYLYSSDTISFKTTLSIVFRRSLWLKSFSHVQKVFFILLN